MPRPSKKPARSGRRTMTNQSRIRWTWQAACVVAAMTRSQSLRRSLSRSLSRSLKKLGHSSLKLLTATLQFVWQNMSLHESRQMPSKSAKLRRTNCGRCTNRNFEVWLTSCTRARSGNDVKGEWITFGFCFFLFKWFKVSQKPLFPFCYTLSINRLGER